MTWTTTNTLTLVGLIVSPMLSALIAGLVANAVGNRRFQVEMEKFRAETNLKLGQMEKSASETTAVFNKEIAEIKRDSDQQEMLLRKIDSNINAIRSDDFGEFRERLARVETAIQVPRRRNGERG